MTYLVEIMLAAASFGGAFALVTGLVRAHLVHTGRPLNARNWVWASEKVAMFGELPLHAEAQPSSAVAATLETHGRALSAALTPCFDCQYIGGWHSTDCSLDFQALDKPGGGDAAAAASG